MTLVSPSPACLLESGADSSSAGILLNSRSISAPLNPPHKEHRQPTPLISSSSSSQLSQSRSRSHSADTSSRKIRFAPLPDPRRDDLTTLFNPDESDSDSLTHTSRHPSTPDDLKLPIPLSPAHSLHSLTDPELHSDGPTFREKPSKPKSKKWGQKLLAPLLQPLKSNSNNKCPDDTVSRVNSRDSTKHTHPNGNAHPNDDLHDVGFKGGTALGRRMSTGCTGVVSNETERNQVFTGGAPLTYVMSEGGGSKSRKEGQRMLNGRVYGRRTSSADREQRQRRQDASEPEFVEWGYGGMGSVSNDHARGRPGATGPDWGKVQSKGRAFGEGQDADPEGDDGSGMGWVRKRREQREREKKEKEQHERAQQQGVPEIEVHPPDLKDKQEITQELTQRERDDCHCEAGNKDDKHCEEEHHVYRAVSVPAPHHRHPRSHSIHKGGGEASGTVTPTSIPSLSRAGSAGSVPRAKAALSSSDDALLTPEAKKEESETSSGSSVKSSSTASSESLGEKDDEDDEDTERESEDEEEEDDESRLTSKSAGVEKISRHKE